MHIDEIPSLSNFHPNHQRSWLSILVSEIRIEYISKCKREKHSGDDEDGLYQSRRCQRVSGYVKGCFEVKWNAWQSRLLYSSECISVCVCVCVCMRACVRACECRCSSVWMAHLWTTRKWFDINPPFFSPSCMPLEKHSTTYLATFAHDIMLSWYHFIMISC